MTTKNNQYRHFFNAPDEDKSSRFCRCGKYLTDEVHIRFNENFVLADVSISANTDEYTKGYRDGWRDCCKDQKEFD